MCLSPIYAFKYKEKMYFFVYHSHYKFSLIKFVFCSHLKAMASLSNEVFVNYTKKSLIVKKKAGGGGGGVLNSITYEAYCYPLQAKIGAYKGGYNWLDLSLFYFS